MKTKLYLSNVSRDTDEDRLNRLFSSAGRVVSVAIVRGRYSRQSRGLALIEMETEAGAERAVARLRGHRLDGVPIEVSDRRSEWAWPR